jgi:hypothetical protein
MATRRGLLGTGAGLAATMALGRRSSAATFVTVLTGGTSGVYYPLGVKLAELYGLAIPGARVTPQPTKASVENLNLLQAGKAEVAFALGDAIADAWAGVEDAGFKAPLKRLRGLTGLYPNLIQIVTNAEAGIQTLADLADKRLSVGAPRSGTELNARKILTAAGLSYEDLAKVEYLPFAESVDLMKNRQLDATLQSAGLGVASIRDLAASVRIRMVAVPADLVAKIGAPYVPATIPAGTYTGQDAAVPTAAIANFLVTHEGVDEATGHAMTKAVFDGLDQLKAAHAAARDIRLETALAGMPVPLHPGAERFFKEAKVL